MPVRTIFRPDRFLRGGDHTPFNQQGFAAVRFTEMNEDFTHQHQDLRTEKGRAYGDVTEGVDFAYLRRELVNDHYLQRTNGRYRTAEQAPTRAAIERQEIPAWEAHWLPGFLAGDFRRER